MRDSMAVALLKLGYSMNTTSEKEINEAAQELVKSKTAGSGIRRR